MTHNNLIKSNSSDVIMADQLKILAKEIKYEKKHLKTIIEESKLIDFKKIAEEILIWAIVNVENYIDNQEKIFKLNLILDTEDPLDEDQQETMPETKALQNLYRAIPDDGDFVPWNVLAQMEKDHSFKLDPEHESQLERIQECREVLNTITTNAFEYANKQQELLDKLYHRMIYYYEMKGMHNGNLLIQELEGVVNIIQFEYESFPVGVRVRSPVIQRIAKVDGEVETIDEGGLIHEYVIPEGFTLWLEIRFKAQSRPSTIF